jgi:GT2 family glycosyltransferase
MHDVPFDVCVVTYGNTADRVIPGLRSCDELLVHDNSSDNLGFGAGANAAARRGRHPFILFVNPDGDLDASTVAKLEMTLTRHGVVGAAADQTPSREAAGRRMRALAPGVHWLSAACLAVRRDAFECVGGFDERLFMYAEDVDLSLRLAKLGELLQVNDAVFRHDENNPNRYRFRMQHLNFRNWLTVLNWHGHRGVLPVIMSAALLMLRGRFSMALPRLTGATAFMLQTKRWPPAPQRDV